MPSRLRSLLPPLLFHYYKASFYSKKVYPTWEAAQRESIGYASDEILEKVAAALLKVKQGEAVYERDSVLFDTVQHAWPVAFGLLAAAARNNGVLNVVDFGGSLGSSYFQNRGLLTGLAKIRWSVVEQPHFVERGKRDFADDELAFYKDLDECCANEGPTAMLLSSVLQYLEDPYALLDELVGRSSISDLIIDRTLLIEDDDFRESVLVQRVPASVYKASYPVRVFGRQQLLDRLRAFRVVAEFDGVDDPFVSRGRTVRSAGLLLTRRGA